MRGGDGDGWRTDRLARHTYIHTYTLSLLLSLRHVSHTPDDIPGRQHRAVRGHVLLAGPDHEGHVGVFFLQEQGAELGEEAGVVFCCMGG